MIDGVISVIVRFHSGGEISYLPDALKSLAFQTHKKVQAVLSLQNCSREQIFIIEGYCKRIFFSQNSDTPSYKIINTIIPDGVDGRCKALNKGIDVAEGEFLSFLDYDDIVYQNANI